MLAHAGGPHSTPLLLEWQLGPPLLALAAAAILYGVGFGRRASRSRRAWLHACCFLAGLLALALALSSPVAAYDDELFWAHMTQHVLLLTVVPPLLVLGRPWSTIPRALPLGMRRWAAGGLAGGSRLARAGRWPGRPAVGLALFCGVLAAWHLPALWDATLRSTPIHDLEHALFLGTGLLFWSQLVDSPPFRSRLDHSARAVYAGVAMLTGWVLAIALALAPEPLYAGYAELGSRPGGISALADQHIAAGIMWVPGSLTLTAAIVVFVYRWLDEGAARSGRPARAGAEP